MDRRVRYEVLASDDIDDREALAIAAEPVPVELVAAAAPSSEDIPYWAEPPSDKDMKQPPMPPSYTIATELPTYEEAERSKQEELEQMEQEQANTEALGNIREIDRFSDMQLGTDGMFLCMFIIAFLFNWIGLLVSVCVTHTVAGRFGAISGFGLSMVKWVAIVKHNNWASGIAEGDSLIWWLLIVLGFLIFFRGCTQYIRIKYQWHRLEASMRNRIYLMF